MTKIILSRAMYIAQLNTELRKHRDYIDGMEIRLVPERNKLPDSATGYDLFPRDPGNRHVFSVVCIEVEKEYAEE